MAVIFEHTFEDTTGIRIVTMPNEELKKETLRIMLRVKTAPNTVKMVKLELVDAGRELTDLQDDFFEAILQHKIKDIGRKCDKCEKYFLPTSPNQKICVRCKEEA